MICEQLDQKNQELMDQIADREAMIARLQADLDSTSSQLNNKQSVHDGVVKALKEASCDKYFATSR